MTPGKIFIYLPAGKFQQNIDKKIWSKSPVLWEMLRSKRQTHFSFSFRL